MAGFGASGKVIEDDSLAAAGTCVSTAGSLGAGAAGVAAGMAGAGAREDAALTETGFALTGAVMGTLTTELDLPATTGLDMAAGVSSCDRSIVRCG